MEICLYTLESARTNVVARLTPSDATLDSILDAGYLPSPVIRAGIRSQLRQRIEMIKSTSSAHAYETKMKYVDLLRSRPIAIETKRANTQHYEVGTGVLKACLGPRMKYSCCLYQDDRGVDVVAKNKNALGLAEERMLQDYVRKADLHDGQTIFDLGCGWGSLSLYLAEIFPNSKITAFSNSRTQKEYIDQIAKSKNFTNLTVITNDIATWTPPKDMCETFDRVLSIELFEHMKNYQLLSHKVSSLLKPRGKCFVHIFAHKDTPYDFDGGWMTEHFFTGGTMPSADLLLYFQDDLRIKSVWWVNGQNYARTCEDWLTTMNANKKEIWPHLQDTYGKDHVQRWFYRWQIFYMACAELFAYDRGETWGVCHYLFEKPAS